MALFITGSEHAVTASSHDQLNGQQCRHSQSADRCQIVQNCLKITHPHQPISEHKFSAALPDQVQWNEKELSSYKETSKLAKPFGDKYFYKEDSLSSGKESSATFQTSISAFVSLSKRCFIVEDGKNATPKSEKLVQNKPNLLTSAKELFKRLEALHIKVGSILWHTLTTAQKCGQLKFEKSHTKQMSSFEACHTKLMRGQGLLVSSKREMAENVVDSGEPKILKPNEARQMQERDIQFCWAEKWRPKRLGDFIFQKQHACDLQLLVCHRRCPHMIFEGPPGVGKISLVRAMIQEIFQSDEDQIIHTKITIHLRADLVTKIVVPIKATSNHIEINLSSLGGYERNVIGLLVNDLHRARLKADLTESTIDYKVIVLREADKLTSDVQHYIHWLMERYQDSCKLIFCCSNANKLRSISSLCKVIHVEPPKNEQIIQVLEHIAEKEGIDLPGPFVKRIAENSEKNLRQAIRSLEACTRSQYPFTENQKILTGWEDDIAKIAKDIVEEQSPKQLYNIRGKLQNLILHNVCPNFVFTTLVEELEQYLDDNLQSKLHYIYSAYSGNSFNDGEPLTKNRRDQDRVVHAKRIAYLYVKIEEFTAKFMSVYKDMKMRYTKENQNQFQIVSD